jgi:hypothetical protein
VLQQDDFELIITVKEKEFVPEVAYINIDGKSHKLKKINKKQFSYTFRNVQKNQSFYISSQEVKSKEFELKTIPKPTLLSFDIIVDYPAYTGLKDETVKNLGDMVIPEGTKLSTTSFKSSLAKFKGYERYTTYEGINVPIRELKTIKSKGNRIGDSNLLNINTSKVNKYLKESSYSLSSKPKYITPSDIISSVSSFKSKS